MLTPKLLIGLLAAAAPASAFAQVLAGPEFRVNQSTPGNQVFPSVAADAQGAFTVVWASNDQGPHGDGPVARRYDPRGAPLSGELVANTFTTGAQAYPAGTDVAVDAAGNFVVVWVSDGQDGSSTGVFGRRFDAAGGALGGEFQANTYTTGAQGDSNPGGVSVARAPDGRFVVVWQGDSQDGSGRGVFGQRYDAAGNAVGSEFRANTYTTAAQDRPDVAIDRNGGFVVVWSSAGQDGSFGGVFGQRFASSGALLGGEFLVNTTTTGYQSGTQLFGPSIARAPGGEFVVVWDDLNATDVFAQRFDASGNRAGAEFLVNTQTLQAQQGSAVTTDALGNFVVSYMAGGSYYGTLARGQRFSADGSRRGAEFGMNMYTTLPPHRFPALASDDVGNFIVAWYVVGFDPGDPGRQVRAQRFGGLRPAALRVDTAGNGVWEPGETVDARPTWRNQNGAAQTFGGVLTGIDGPAGPTYTVTDGAADYGAVPDDASVECADCYGVSVAGARPAVHWDASAIESITPDTHGQQKRWSLHIGESFTDVPAASPFYRFIETLLHHSVTGGCAGSLYCPQSATTREQMAVFVLAAREGPGYAPPACSPPNLFADVPETSPFCRWIEELANRGVVAGCGPGLYCPAQAITREQMAVFVLRTLEPSSTPPPCAPPNLFSDVPETSPFCRWIEELAVRGVVTGCSANPPLYCPLQAVTREQMGVFIGVTFGLTLYGP